MFLQGWRLIGRPKLGPRRPKGAPRWPQMRPEWPIKVELGSEMAKSGRRSLPDRAETAQRGPKTGQDGAREAPARPEMGRRWAQDRPRWPQDGPKMAQDGPKLGPSWRIEGHDEQDKAQTVEDQKCSKTYQKHRFLQGRRLMV